MKDKKLKRPDFILQKDFFVKNDDELQNNKQNHPSEKTKQKYHTKATMKHDEIQKDD